MLVLRIKAFPRVDRQSGVNKVERLLGRELCVLAWAAECTATHLIPNAIRNWVTLRPEERWWLFAMAANITGTSEDADIGWRKALRVALSETPTGDAAAQLRAKRPRTPVDAIVPQIELFENRVP